MKKILPVRLSFLCLSCFAALFLYAAESAPLNSTAKLHARSKANVVIEKLNRSVSLTPDQRKKILDWSDRLSSEAQQSDSLDIDKQMLYINRNAKGILRYALDSVYTETQKQAFAIKVQARQQTEINKVILSTAN